MENKDTQNTKAAEPALATYGMSAELRDSDLLTRICNLSNSDKKCLIRFIYQISEPDAELFDSLHDDQSPYTLEELNARIDEAEAEMDCGEGKSFVEMMNDFKKELLWLK